MKIVLALGLMGGLGCSKTQDTAPQTRLFGQPPVIQSVTVNSSQLFVHCDFTAMAQVYLHDTWNATADMYTFGSGSNFIVDGGFAETVVTARVQDPEDTATTSDVLLVTTSFQVPTLPTPEEDSLIMFDDGSSNQFQYKQQFGQGEICTVDVVNGVYTCAFNLTGYYLTSNDRASGDHVFTRAFAYTIPGGEVYSNGLALLNDCVASQVNQYPAAGTLVKDKALPLKIEAVDKEGNIATWPTQPTTTIVPSSLHSSTDECTLCMMTSADILNECKNKPGFVITTPPPPLGGYPPVPLGPFCVNYLTQF